MIANDRSRICAGCSRTVTAVGGGALALATVRSPRSVHAFADHPGTVADNYSISVGNKSSKMAMTPDGAHLYVSNQDDATVSVIEHGHQCRYGHGECGGLARRNSDHSRRFASLCRQRSKRCGVGDRGGIEYRRPHAVRGRVLRCSGGHPRWEECLCFRLCARSERGRYRHGYKLGQSQDHDRCASWLYGDLARWRAFVRHLDRQLNKRQGSGSRHAQQFCRRDHLRPVGGRTRWWVSPDSSRLYVAVTGLQGALQVFDTGTNAVKAAMSVDSMPMGMAWNPNGFLLYLAVSGTSRFVVSDTTTNQSVGLFAAGVGAVDAVITPDGKTLYASDIGDNTLTVFDITAPDLSGTPPTGRVDELYSYAFALAGSPYAWTDPVMLPPGVVLSPAGVISGTPTQVGMFTVTVEAKNYNTRAISRQVTITIADVDSCTNGSSGPSSGSWLGQPGAGGNGSLSSGSAGSSGGC